MRETKRSVHLLQALMRIKEWDVQAIRGEHLQVQRLQQAAGQTLSALYDEVAAIQQQMRAAVTQEQELSVTVLVRERQFFKQKTAQLAAHEEEKRRLDATAEQIGGQLKREQIHLRSLEKLCQRRVRLLQSGAQRRYARETDELWLQREVAKK